MVYKSSDYETIVKYRRKLKLKLVEIMGNKCVNCNENDIDVLQFDHINDNGYEDKVIENGKIKRQYRAITDLMAKYNKDNNMFKNEYQILCANCNQRKEIIRRELLRLRKISIPPF